MTEKAKRGVSRAQWLEAALNALCEKSVSEVTIDGLAKTLGVARAGFYWHFRVRDELLQGMLDYWVHELTEVISQNQELAELVPEDRLIQTAEMILEYDLTRYDLSIRQWALQDKIAAAAVRRVNRLRIQFVRQAFDDLVFDHNEAEMRAMLFVCYHTWETTMFREVSRKRRRQLIEARVGLLTKI